jgi:hypothetical protein
MGDPRINPQNIYLHNKSRIMEVPESQKKNAFPGGRSVRNRVPRAERARARGLALASLLMPVAIPVTSRVGAGAPQPLASAEGRRSRAGRPLDADGWLPATGSHDHDEPSQTGHQVSQPPGRKHSGSAPLDGRTASGGMSIHRWLSSSAPKSALFCRLPFTEPGPASCTQRDLCS